MVQIDLLTDKRELWVGSKYNEHLTFKPEKSALLLVITWLAEAEAK